MRTAERVALWLLYIVGGVACALIVGGWLLGMSRAVW